MATLAAYFNFEGRLSAIQYWRAQVRLGIAAVVVISATTLATVVGGWLGAIPFLLVFPLLAAGLSLCVRRLHDRGKSAWWLAVYCVSPGVLVSVGAPWGFSEKTLWITTLCTLVAVAFMGWFWLEVGFLRGQKGPNRYGDDPRGARLFR